MNRIRLFVTFLWILSPVAQATPCPGFYVDPKDAGKLADWVVEGIVTEVRKTGTFQDCERMPSQNPGWDLYCADIDKPEIIVLEDVTVIRDNNELFSTASRVEISRMSHCFSGPLSPMNRKPELKAVGKRVRFYGGESKIRVLFLQPGYFWAEILE